VIKFESKSRYILTEEKKSLLWKDTAAERVRERCVFFCRIEERFTFKCTKFYTPKHTHIRVKIFEADNGLCTNALEVSFYHLNLI